MADEWSSFDSGGWQYQGRQEHGWFGHGTKPKDDPDVVSRALDARIRLVASIVIGGLPAKQRYHPSAKFNAAETEQLVRAMSGWVLGLHMLPAEFADRFIGSDAQSPVVHHLREAAEHVANAHTHADMRAATDALAAGMLAIGLDRWPRKLDELAARAGREVEALREERYRLGVKISAAPYNTAAIDYNPMDVPLSPAATAVQHQIFDIAKKVVAQVQTQIIGVNRSSAGSILHVYFRRAVEAAHIPGVTVEESFEPGGTRADYGADGSKRTDVVLRLPGTKTVEAIWDWKVGMPDLR